MEIEPGILNVGIVELRNEFSELVADSQLAALSVNQVHEVLLFIHGVGLCDVLLGSLERLVEVGAHDNGWGPLHGRLHAPMQGNRATDLKV